MPLAEVGPRGRHLRATVSPEAKVRLLLVRLHLVCVEHRRSLTGVVSERITVSRLVSVFHSTYFVVSCDLIESVVLCKLFVPKGILAAFLGILFSSLCPEVLGPGAAMVPVRLAQLVFHLWIDDDTFLGVLGVFPELSIVHGLVPMPHGSDSEVCSTSFEVFAKNVKLLLVATGVSRVVSVRR